MWPIKAIMTFGVFSLLLQCIATFIKDFAQMIGKPLERFPKSGNRFSDKKRGEDKDLERFAAADAKAKTALEENSGVSLENNNPS